LKLPISEFSLDTESSSTISDVVKIISSKLIDQQNYSVKELILKGSNGLLADTLTPFMLDNPGDVCTLNVLLSQSSVDSLKIDGCNLECCIHLLPCFYNLVNLSLPSNKLGSESFKVLADVVNNSCSLKTLNLSNNRAVNMYIYRGKILGCLDLSGIEFFFQSLQRSKTMISVNLSDNYLGGFDTSNIFEQNNFSSSSSSSSSRNINTNEYSKYGRDVIEMVVLLLQETTTIININLNSNGFENSEHLAKMLISEISNQSKCKSLIGLGEYFLSCQENEEPLKNTKEIDLSFQNLSPFTGHLLGHEIRIFSQLINLNLSGNCKVRNILINI
jgi:hypothetical protein